jgi:hypothetical protein
MAGSGRLLPSGPGNSCSENGGKSCDNPVIASRMTSFANRSVRRSPKRPHRPPRQCQGNDDAILVRAQPIMSVEQQEKCLRQGRRSSEGGSKPRSPLRPSRRALPRRKCRADARAHATGSGLSTRCSRPVCWAPRTNAVPRSPHAALPAR